MHFTYKHILPTNAHKTCILLKFKIKFGVCYHTILRGDVCCFQLQLKLALQLYRKLSFCSCTLLYYRPLVALLSYSMEQSPSWEAKTSSGRVHFTYMLSPRQVSVYVITPSSRGYQMRSSLKLSNDHTSMYVAFSYNYNYLYNCIANSCSAVVHCYLVIGL